MAIIGVGTDIISIHRVEKSYRSFGEKFVNRILTADEQLSSGFQSHPIQYLAKRFAAKEAIMKALGTGMSEGIGFESFSILNDDAGKPFVNVHDSATSFLTLKDVAFIHISISDEKEFATAFAVAESK